MLALLLRRAAREPELEELRDLRASTKVRARVRARVRVGLGLGLGFAS